MAASKPSNRPAVSKFVLFGFALPANVVEDYPAASAAAARWQMSFLEAVGSEFDVDLVAFSCIPTGSKKVKPSVVTKSRIELHLMPRASGLSGALRYATLILRAIFQVRRSASCIFCYNALLWTAPWAALLGQLANAPVILLLADLDPVVRNSSRRTLKGLIERGLLRTAKRFIVFSPAAVSILPKNARQRVFSGIAEESAMSMPPVHYDSTPHFAYVGSIGPESGSDLFVAAANIVLLENSNVEFHIFGRGVPSVVSASVSPRIRFHGFVAERELDEFMGRSCVGVNPRPHMEGLNQHNAPYKLLYYLSRGMTTITTVTEGVPDELARLCVLADDTPEGIADAMQTVIAMTPAERNYMGERARAVLRETRSPRVLAGIIRSLMV